MEKKEYIEYCRQLFGNPLMNDIYMVTVDGWGYAQTWRTRHRKPVISEEYWVRHCYGGLTLPTGENTNLDFPWQESLVSRSDFEQGGKYYEELEENCHNCQTKKDGKCNMYLQMGGTGCRQFKKLIHDQPKSEEA